MAYAAAVSICSPTMTTKSFVLVVDMPSEDRCTVTATLGVYTSHSRAKTERARLNKIRAAEVTLRASRLVGRDYFKPKGQAYVSYEKHTEASARKYAEYEVPRLRIVTTETDAEVPNAEAIFKTERY